MVELLVLLPYAATQEQYAVLIALFNHLLALLHVLLAKNTIIFVLCVCLVLLHLLSSHALGGLLVAVVIQANYAV